MTTTTPNMSLIEPVPGPGGTPGPAWASTVNSDLELIDQHDHSPGRGVAIGSAGISIDTDLSFNNFSATTLKTLQLTSQVTAPASTAAISVVSGELTYTDSLGNVVAITSGGSVAGATGSISGLSPYNDGVARTPSAVFSSVTKSFSWLYDSARSARMASGDLIVYPYDGTTSYSNSVTLKSDLTLAASYALTLPLALPTQTNIVSLDTTGALSSGVAAGTAGAPSLAFAAELTTGLYRPASGELGFATSGTQRVNLSTAGVRLTDGSDATPSYSFLNDPDTGFYSDNTDQIGIACGGVRVAAILPFGFRLTAGTAADPSYTFLTDPDTGIYSAGPDGGEIRFATQGTQRANFNDSGIRLIDGTTSNPSYSFLSDTNTGLYSDGADSIAVTIGGTTTVGISSAGMFCGDATTASKIKWKVFTGNINTTPITLTSPGSLVLGVVGYFNASTTQSDNQWNVIGGLDAGDPQSNVYFNQTATGGGNTAVLDRDTGSGNRAYRVIMYYQ